MTFCGSFALQASPNDLWTFTAHDQVPRQNSVMTAAPSCTWFVFATLYGVRLYMSAVTTPYGRGVPMGFLIIPEKHTAGPSMHISGSDSFWWLPWLRIKCGAYCIWHSFKKRIRPHSAFFRWRTLQDAFGFWVHRVACRVPLGLV